MLSMVLGARSRGKTYSFKKFCIDKALKNDQKKFIYMRRYKTELTPLLKQKFLDDLQKNGYYTDYELVIKGNEIVVKDQDNIKKTIGYFLALSESVKLKSIPLQDVAHVIFDEFILETGVLHYIKNEVSVFMSIVSSINRYRSGNEKCRFFLLANAVTVTNPYFIYYGIRSVKEGINKIGKQIIVEYDNNKVFAESMKNTEMYELMKHSKDADYIISNEFMLDDNMFIEEKSPYSKYYCTLIYNSKKYGIFYDYTQGRFYCTTSVDDTFKLIFAVNGKDLRPNTMILKNNEIFRILKKYYVQGFVYFEDQHVKGCLQGCFQALFSI